jgi:hypothetical protein
MLAVVAIARCANRELQDTGGPCEAWLMIGQGVCEAERAEGAVRRDYFNSETML